LSPEVPGVVERRSQVPQVRLEAILVASDSTHAVVIGTSDNGSVRVRARIPVEVGTLLAATATIVGPIEFEVPHRYVESIEEIDPSAEG
jgi:hypothetical protein